MRKFLSIILVIAIISNLVMASPPQYDLIIVRNDDIIDYLIALPYSHLLNIPILPVNPKKLDKITEAQLYSYIQLGRNSVLIVGNANAVSLEVEDKLKSMGFKVTRIGGADRTETAEKLALHFYPNGSKTVVLASAWDYGSTLAASEFAMKYKYPLLLTWENQLSPAALAGIKQLKAKIVILVGLGLNESIEKTLEDMGYETYWIGRDIEPPPIVTTQSTPQHPPASGSKIYFLLGMIAMLIIMSPIIFYLHKRIVSRKQEILEQFNEKEIAVLKAIIENGGEIKQEELPELVGYSRPTISRIIQDLEKKGIVAREKSGKTFIVKMIKKIKLD
ncbi:cell wall-binding repeat-containing protein [Pyrococcus sp. ST04]|uniref:cell wall-binding repeat-containing protein n=1 Tax=Pyrococcus sp. ST04 TaxID=1183377 RepID=UPI0002605B68|nr:N-acetylmuramoyl-L-alanine amidase modifier [Pyrococcus sp. ST04]